MDIYDIKLYREAKQLIPHLKVLIEKLTNMEAALIPYGNFLPVAKILVSIRFQKGYVIQCYNTYANIEKKRGIRE